MTCKLDMLYRYVLFCLNGVLKKLNELLAFIELGDFVFKSHFPSCLEKLEI